MNQGHKVKELIKDIVNGKNNETFKVYLGYVLFDQQCNVPSDDPLGYPNFVDYVGRTTSFDHENLTVAVMLVNNKSDTDGYISDSDYIPSDNGIINGVPSLQPNPTIISSVRVMCDVEDGSYNIPTQGSSVLVGMSTYLDPFIIQFSGLSQIINAATSQDLSKSVINTTNFAANSFILLANDSDGNPIAGSAIEQSNSSVDILVSDQVEYSNPVIGEIVVDFTGSNTTKLHQDTTNIELLAGDASSFTTIYDQTKDKIQIQVPAGPNFIIQPSSGKTLGEMMLEVTARLTDICNALQTITYTNSSGPAAITPASIPTITNIITNITSLNSDINNLLG